jgi:hypothetical protein
LYHSNDASLDALKDKVNYLTSKLDDWQYTPKIQEDSSSKRIQDKAHEISKSHTGRENAAIVMFAKNSDLSKVLETMHSFEDRFNKIHNYDWILISDASHSISFQKMTNAITQSAVIFETIPRSPYLSLPAGVDKLRMKESKKHLKQKKIEAARTERQRHIKRFWSRDIYNMEFLKDYDYYMRVQPGTWFHCDLKYDPFQYMRENGKTYGFGLALEENTEGYPTLWSNVMTYIEENPVDVDPGHLLQFVSNGQAESFNGCHFRSELEIGDLQFFRGEKYQRLATFLDSKHGIYYEAWDDSTVRTLGVTLLQSRERLQFLSNLGYNDQESKRNLKQCPMEKNLRLHSKCTCDPIEDLTWSENSCLPLYFKVNGVELPLEVTLREEEAERQLMLKEQQAEEARYKQEQYELEREREEVEVADLMNENGPPPEIEKQHGEHILP